MEYLAYALLPLLAIGGVLVYSQMARKKVMGQVDAGFGGQLFHDSQARYFPQLGPRERILAVWNGLAFTQPRSAAGAALNAVSAHVIGVSTYVPMVMVALTTEGRVLVSEEYSEGGVRGYFRPIAVVEAGARAVTGPGAIPGFTGTLPKNPGNPLEQLEAAAIYANDGTLVHMGFLQSTALAGPQLAQPISAVLPFNPAYGPQLWASMNPGAPQL